MVTKTNIYSERIKNFKFLACFGKSSVCGLSREIICTIQHSAFLNFDVKRRQKISIKKPANYFENYFAI